MTTIPDRYRGCLMGLAAGDAVGTTVEFELPGTFPLVTGMEGGGPLGLEPGQWTDDTSMALCLVDSLVSCGQFDVRDQMDRYVRWTTEGYLSSNGRCFDIGATVSDALRRYRSTGDPLSGSTDPYSAGNGSLMRLAAVPLFYARDPENAVRMSGRVPAPLTERRPASTPAATSAASSWAQYGERRRGYFWHPGIPQQRTCGTGNRFVPRSKRWRAVPSWAGSPRKSWAAGTW